MNKLMKYLFFILMVFCLRYETSAQPGSLPFRNNSAPRYRPEFRANENNRRPNNMRKLDAVKNAYINKQLSLTPEEADRFWPIYNQYQDELGDILRQRRVNNANATAGVDQLDKDLHYEQQIVLIKKHYRDEFLKVLSMDKVNMLYKSEKEFRDEVFKQWRERNRN